MKSNSKYIMNVTILPFLIFTLLNIPFFLSGDFDNDIVENINSWKVEFEENFSGLTPQDEPENLFILDGSFLVEQNKAGNQLELSGSPVGDFGFMFGPRVREKAMELNFSFLSSKQGRRYPAIAAGIGGIRGYRFRWNASTRKILIYNDETLLLEKVFTWESDQWWKIRFQVIPLKQDKNLLKLKIWPRDLEEPKTWLVEHSDDVLFKGGKCVIWGYPYAGTPIKFDDIRILSIER